MNEYGHYMYLRDVISYPFLNADVSLSNICQRCFRRQETTDWYVTPAPSLGRGESLQWRHNDHDGVSNHQPHDCLLNRLFRRRLKKTSKLRVTGLCAGIHRGPVNSPHKWPVTRKMFPFDDVIMCISRYICMNLKSWKIIVRPWPIAANPPLRLRYGWMIVSHWYSMSRLRWLCELCHLSKILTS